MPAAAQVTLPQMAADFRAAADRLRRPPAALLDALKLTCVGDFQENFRTASSPDGVPWAPLAFPRPRGGASPLRDTGLLMASVGGGRGYVERRSGATLEVGTNMVQAGLMQLGGVVAPRRGKYLAIPLTPEAKRAGSPRNFPRPLVPRIGSRGGVLLVKGEEGRGPAYALARRVVVPARPFLGAGPRLVAKLIDVCRAFIARGLGAE